MFVYIFLLLMIIYGINYFDFSKSNKKYKTFYVFLYIVLSLIAGLRYRIGIDTIQYEDWFNNSLPLLKDQTLSYLRSSNSYEALFEFSASLIKTIGGSWIVFQLIHSFFINASVFIFINRYSSRKFLSVLLYFLFAFYVYNCEIMRQSIASALFLFAIPYLQKKQFLKYLFLIIVACFFHKTAIILVILPLLCMVKSPKLILISSIVIFASLSIASAFFHNNFVQISLMMSMISEGTGADFINYSEQMESMGLTMNGLALYFFKFVLMYWFCIKYLDNNTQFYEMKGIVFLYMLLGILQASFPIFYRLLWVVEIVPIIFIAEFISLNKLHTRQLCYAYNSTNQNLPNCWLKLIVVFLFCVSLFPRIFQKEETGARYYVRYTPYSSVIDKKISIERERVYNYYDRY